jgi:hypothetical protein
MKLKSTLFTAVAIIAFPCAAWAQFTDTFDTINPAWVTNRYEPAGFESVVFDGDSRLRITVDQTGSAANRNFTYSSGFYDTQGRARPGGISGLWAVSANVYISSDFNTTTGQLVRSDLWAHTGTTPAGGDYATFGFTNEAGPDRAFRLLVFSGATGSVKLDVANNFQFDAWHALSITSTGSAFEFRLDNTLVFSATTTAGSDLLSAMVQSYNFGGSGNYTSAVYWDNVTTSAIPEPAVSALLGAVGALGVALWRRRRAVARTR